MKTIFFDFGRTVVEHPEDSAGLEIIKRLGVQNDADAVLIRDIIFSVAKYSNFLDEGSMSRRQYKKLLLDEIPEHLGKTALKAADYHIGELPMIAGMHELLTKLKNDGYKLYITSNLDEYHVKQMPFIKAAEYFDGMIFSSQIKVRKPHKEFFEAALSRFGVTAGECLFIDDLEENVKGAELCGIKGFVFKGDVKSAEEFIYQNS